MEYVRKVTDYREPDKSDRLTYNTIWVVPYERGFNGLFIQKSKNYHLPKWEFLGYEITEHIEEFWRDENDFIRQAQYLFNLDEEEVRSLKERMPHSN